MPQFRKSTTTYSQIYIYSAHRINNIADCEFYISLDIIKKKTYIKEALTQVHNKNVDVQGTYTTREDKWTDFQ